MDPEAELDAVIIGAGPNGLAASVELARQGASVLVVEAADEIGGGTRTAELTEPGFHHDVCSAVHPMGALSPYLSGLPLADHGLHWIHPPASVAHPMDDGPAVMLYPDLDKTGEGLGADARAWRRLLSPFLRHPHALLADVMGPLRIPQRPIQMAHFGLLSAIPAATLARMLFQGQRARALFAGCAGHAIMPLEHILTSALGILFSMTAHVETWPVARGGSRSITAALAAYFEKLGGKIETGQRVATLDDLPRARVYLFDTSPAELSTIAGDALPAIYRRRLSRYHYGPGVFKLDWALDGPIPWRDPACLEASTVHVGGTLDEIARSESQMWKGHPPDAPYLILCQQSQFDDSRAPAGKHTGYAYCHVPHGSIFDMTDRIEAQIERFAPGFRDLIRERHAMTAADMHAYNPNYLGGAITGGVAGPAQLFTRPVARLDPYSTPNPKLMICSASTPPGGGVHGMCGYHAARSALRRLH